MMTITSSIGLAVHIGQSFWMAEVAGCAQGQVKGHRRILRPIVRNLELSAHHEVGKPLAPVRVWVDRYPVTIIHLEADGRRLQGTGELSIAKGRKWLMAAIDQ